MQTDTGCSLADAECADDSVTVPALTLGQARGQLGYLGERD